MGNHRKGYILSERCDLIIFKIPTLAAVAKRLHMTRVAAGRRLRKLMQKSRREMTVIGRQELAVEMNESGRYSREETNRTCIGYIGFEGEEREIGEK